MTVLRVYIQTYLFLICLYIVIHAVHIEGDAADAAFCGLLVANASSYICIYIYFPYIFSMYLYEYMYRRSMCKYSFVRTYLDMLNCHMYTLNVVYTITNAGDEQGAQQMCSVLKIDLHVYPNMYAISKFVRKIVQKHTFIFVLTQTYRENIADVQGLEESQDALCCLCQLPPKISIVSGSLAERHLQLVRHLNHLRHPIACCWFPFTHLLHRSLGFTT